MEKHIKNEQSTVHVVLLHWQMANARMVLDQCQTNDKKSVRNGMAGEASSKVPRTVINDTN